MAVELSGTALVVGGTSGIGLAMARRLAGLGMHLWLTGRTQARADQAAASVGGACRGIALDTADTSSIAKALENIGQLDYVVFAAMERDGNKQVRTYNPVTASRSLVVKFVGSVEVLHCLGDRLSAKASILIFGGAAYQRPASSSITTATMGGGVIGLARALAIDLAPVRCNVIHPGVVGDTELAAAWGSERLQEVIDRTPIGRLVTTDEVVEAGISLLSNPALNGVNLIVDGGWVLT